jgi:hypothetical protein
MRNARGVMLMAMVAAFAVFLRAYSVGQASLDSETARIEAAHVAQVSNEEKVVYYPAGEELDTAKLTIAESAARQGLCPKDCVAYEADSESCLHACNAAGIGHDKLQCLDMLRWCWAAPAAEPGDNNSELALEFQRPHQ